MKRTAIVGGGFFGLYVAKLLAERGREVVVLERNNDFMQEASYYNQARVHRGYHYPRSLTTGLSCQENYIRFKRDYNECIFDSFNSIYAISKQNSKVTAYQFEEFCKRINAPIQRLNVKNIFAEDQVEQAFRVEECCFDSNKLKKKILFDLEKLNVELRLRSLVNKIIKQNSSFLLSIENQSNIEVDDFYLCCYADPNALLARSGLPSIGFKQQIAEICLVDVPQELNGSSVTLMDGPFFSLMPFPAENCHSLSHVRFTPHKFWDLDGERAGDLDLSNEIRNQKFASNFSAMKCDASRFVPILKHLKLKRSFYMVKTLLPRSYINDGRPILFLKNHGYEGAHIVVGAKIENIFDLESLIQ